MESTPSYSPVPSFSDTSPATALFTPEDEEILFSVMNSNSPVEAGNYWFPQTKQGDLASLDSILSTTPATSLDRKKRSQSIASMRYRNKKKAETDQLSIENSALKQELQNSQHNIANLMQQVSLLQAELYKAQLSLQHSNAQQANIVAEQSIAIVPNEGSQNLAAIEQDLQATMERLQSCLQVCFSVDMHATYEVLAQRTDIKTELESSHSLTLRYHNTLCDMAKKIITPNMHAYWSLFEPPRPQPPAAVQSIIVPSECVFEVADANNAWWRDYMADAHVTQKQMEEISSLQRRYCHGTTRIKKERYQYSLQIREFYWQKVYRIQLRFPGPHLSDTKSDLQVAQVELICKLQLLKHNIEEERTLLVDTYNELAHILKPLQEAMLLVRLYLEAQSHLEHFHSVHDIWGKMSGTVAPEEKSCMLM